MVINTTSKGQESMVVAARNAVVKRLTEEFGVVLHYEREWKLAEVVRKLRLHFPDVPFFYNIREFLHRAGRRHPFHAGQGRRLLPDPDCRGEESGDERLAGDRGEASEAKGNAIERLGKNVIGFRTAMLNEGIIPFVCFGDGCDFHQSSSILDRVVTIAMFGPLNEIQVVPQGDKGAFNRGSFFFGAWRRTRWRRSCIRSAAEASTTTMPSTARRFVPSK